MVRKLGHETKPEREKNLGDEVQYSDHDFVHYLLQGVIAHTVAVCDEEFAIAA